VQSADTLLARLLAALLVPASALAASALDEPGLYEPGEERWLEQVPAVPPYPAREALVELPVVTEGERFRYWVDLPSISVGADGVVRYTVVIESPQGARNVFFEGIDCRREDYRIYAYGVDGERLQPVPDGKWRRIEARGALAYRDELFRQYLCDPRRFALPEPQIRRRLERARVDPGVSTP
jgi:hypothetical protein